MSIDTERLGRLIANFVADTAHVQGAALVTADGLPVVSTLPAGLEESRAAAMAAAVISLSDRIGTELHRGDMQYILLQGTDGYGILTLCAENTLFLVLASSSVKQGVLMLEIRRMLSEIARLLATAHDY